MEFHTLSLRASRRLRDVAQSLQMPENEALERALVLLDRAPPLIRLLSNDGWEPVRIVAVCGGTTTHGEFVPATQRVRIRNGRLRNSIHSSPAKAMDAVVKAYAPRHRPVPAWEFWLVEGTTVPLKWVRESFAL